jgi:hypothetical protein
MDFTIFEARPGLAVLMLPDAPKFTVLAASNDYIERFALTREAFVGRGFLNPSLKISRSQFQWRAKRESFI